MITAYCLNCHFPLVLDDLLTVGLRIVCPDCKIASEVIGLDPLELDWVYDTPNTDVSPLSLYDEDWWYYSSHPLTGP